MIRGLALCLLLSGCAGAGIIAAALPKVAANGQAGALNAQTVGQTNVTRPTVTNSSAGRIEQTGTSQGSVRADQVRQITVNNRIPLIYWIALIAALMLDSPRRWPEEIINGIRGKWGT